MASKRSIPSAIRALGTSQPETGGFTPFQPSSVFRIDHDQAFQNVLNLRYQYKNREYIDWVWRYDSGLVVSSVPDVSAALALTPH